MKPIQLLYLALVPLLLVACQKAPEQQATDAPKEPTLETDAQIYSYGVGYQIGSQMSASPIEMDEQGVITGLQDALAEKDPRVEQQQLQEVAQRLQQQMESQQQAEREALSETNAAASEAFLAANAEKPNVVTLDNGLQYRIIESAEGEKPAATDTVKVDYRGTLVDGTEFDSSYARGEPAEFPLNAVIPGWQQALQLMPVGSKWEIFIPSDLAYGPGGQGPIPPSSALIFEVELLEIVPPASVAEEAQND